MLGKRWSERARVHSPCGENTVSPPSMHVRVVIRKLFQDPYCNEVCVAAHGTVEVGCRVNVQEKHQSRHVYSCLQHVPIPVLCQHGCPPGHQCIQQTTHWVVIDLLAVLFPTVFCALLCFCVSHSISCRVCDQCNWVHHVWLQYSSERPKKHSLDTATLPWNCNTPTLCRCHAQMCGRTCRCHHSSAAMLQDCAGPTPTSLSICCDCLCGHIGLT